MTPLPEPTFTISKRFSFSASHRLEGLAPDHPCGRLHGHTYTVEVILSGPLDSVGMVLDYRELGRLREFVTHAYDHRDLNEQLICNPTAENIAATLLHVALQWYPAVVAVRVSESPDTWAECRVAP